MSRILLQTTIPEHPDDWEITRFSLLADELRGAGHEVIARNRVNLADDDPVLSRLDELNYDQLSRRMADRWAERSPNRPSTTSPTTTGIDRGAPSFVTEPPGRQIKDDPSRLAVFKDYVRNIATWLQPATGRHTSEDRYHQRIPAHQ